MFGEDNSFTFKKLILIIIIVFVIASVTSYLIFYFITDDQSQEDKESKEEENEGITHSLGDFVVNLQGTSSKYLRVSIVLVVDKKDVKAEIEENDARLEDLVISALRSQEIEKIEEPGTPVLKSELKNKINQSLAKGQITDVLFTELIVQ